MAAPVPIDDLPGYRRRFVVTPGAGWVRAELEDDYHCMAVTIRHVDGVATIVEPALHRAPWTTCPGAEAKLVATFTGVPLVDFASRGEKPFNCTHLHDLATLAAAHVGDPRPVIYDVLVSDPVDRLNRAELRRDGETIFAWTLERFTVVAPADVAGIDLLRMKPLLERLDPLGQEGAKILRWGIMVGSGRTIPLDMQSDATKMPSNCYTFQPEMKVRATRIGVIRDFSAGHDALLDGRYHRSDTGLSA